MKKVKLLYLTHCPYCKNAFKALEELYAENEAYKTVEIEKIEESLEPEKIQGLSYYYVPTMFVGDTKAYEASPGQGFEEIKEKVKAALDMAL